MPMRHTDVVIIGGELAGAVVAAVCARAGRRVVVLEEGEGDHALTLGGVCMPPPDDLFPNLDLLHRGLAPLDALGQKQDLRRTAPVSSVAFQVLHPAHRLDVFVDKDHRLADLRREMGPAGEATHRLLDEHDAETRAAWECLDTTDPLCVEGFFATRKARSLVRERLAAATRSPLDQMRNGDWLQEAMQGGLGFGAHAQQVHPAFAQRLWRAWLTGVHLGPTGTRNALRGQLLEAARQRGAEVNRDERVAAVVVEGGRISEIRLSGRSDAITARVVVDATLSRDLRDRVSPEKHAKRLDLAMAAVPVVRQRVGVAWVVKPEGIPPGVMERGLLSAVGKGAGESVALLGIHRHLVNAETRKPAPELLGLTLACVEEPARAQAAVERLVARLDALFPFTRRHLVDQKLVGMDRPHAALGAIYGGPEDPWLLGGRGVDGGFKGLFRAGRDVAPPLGVEGELWAGQAVAHHAIKALSRKPLFGGQGADAPAVR